VVTHLTGLQEVLDASTELQGRNKVSGFLCVACCSLVGVFLTGALFLARFWLELTSVRCKTILIAPVIVTTLR